MLKLDVWNIAFTVMNLLILYWFMKRFLVGPVTAIMAERQSMIERDLDAAAKTKGEAREMKQQYEISMGHADEEAAQIVADARAKAGEEYEKIMDRAGADAKKRLEDAEKTILLEQEKTMHDLETSIAGLAMTAAAKLLEETKGSSLDQETYDRFLKKAGESHD